MAKAIDHAVGNHCGGILGDKMMTKRMMPIVKPKAKNLKHIRFWRSFFPGTAHLIAEWHRASHFDGTNEHYTIFDANQRVIGAIRLAPGDWLTTVDDE